MTHHSRRIPAVLALLGTCVSALPTAAHEGSHAPSVLARVETATTLGDRVTLRLTLTGLGHPLVLQELTAPGAFVQFQGSLDLDFAQDTDLIAAVVFDDAPPGIFTLLLDFGAAGQGAVTVIADGPINQSQQEQEG